MICMPIMVFASDNITLNVSEDALKVGDEIIVTAVAPDDFHSYAMMATFKYDKSVFYEIDADDFETLDDTVEVVFNEENNKFGIIIKSGAITDELFKVHLKVKKDANVGNTNIALTNISSSDGDEKEEFASVSTKVLITRDAKDGETITNNQENKIVEDDETIIETFSNQPIVLGSAIGTILLLVCVIYFIISKRDKKIIFITGGALVVFGALLGTLLIFNSDKKDVNNDGTVDYADAREIIEYLIGINGTKEENNSSLTNNNSTTDKKPSSKPSSTANKKTNKDKYDTNNDGKVDIDDVGSTIDDVNKEAKVLLTEENPNQENYVNKGEVTLNFKADITPKDAKIKKVKLNDEYYDVTLNNGVYSVTVNTPLDYGKHNFTIVEVELNTGKKVKTYLSFTREILKTVPVVNHFNLDEHNKTITFNLVDEDEAFISGDVTIYDGSNVEKSFEITETGTNTIEDFNLEEDKKYNIEIKGIYDLDGDLENENNYYEDETMFIHTFVMTSNYNFTLNNVSITDALQPGEYPVVSFTSSNTKNAVIENAFLSIDNGESKEYVITKRKGNDYEVELTGTDITPGKHSVTLDSVDLSTLKLFQNEEDYKTNTLTYTVLKDAPKAEDIKLTADKNKKNINVSFKLKDDNYSIRKLNVVLVDSTDKIIDSKELIMDDFILQLMNHTPINLSFYYGNSTDGNYTVKVLADYDLSDTYKYTNKSIGENKIFVYDDEIYISDMYIVNDSNVRVDNYYPTKGQKNYKLVVEVNVSDSINKYATDTYKKGNYQRVSGVTINGLNYTASQISGYKSRVVLNIPNDSGVLDIRADRVQLAINQYYVEVNDSFSVKPKTMKIDVLKDKPTIKNLTVLDEDYDNNQVKFRFFVQDDNGGFNKGTISLDGQTQDIHFGENEVTFTDIKKDEDLELVFKGDYDLDTDLLNDQDDGKDKNYYTDTEFYKTTYGLYSQETYNQLVLKDLKVISDNGDEYFEKNEKINLSFTLNDSDVKFNIDKVVIAGNEYKVVNKGNTYNVVVDGYTTAGVKNLTITDVVLNNGKKVTLSNQAKFKVEILKDVIKVADYKYEHLDKQIKVSFALNNFENALVGNAKIKITDDKGNSVYDDDYKDEVTFDIKEDVIRYNVKVIAEYDRDGDLALNSSNHYSNVVLLDEVISLDKNNIEFKDIVDISLYKKELENDEEVISLKDEVDVDDITKNKDDYFIEIVMSNLPSTRAKIKDVVTTNNVLTLVLEYEFATRENTNQTQTIRVDFGTIKDGKAINEYHPANAFNVLITSLKDGKDVTLERDYDASTLNVSGEYYISEYSGKLNGNGHTIKNLTKPLFNNLKGEVSNLKLTNVVLASTNAHGAVANTATGAKLDGVLLLGIKKSSSEATVGSLIGSMSNTTVENCKADNISISFDSFQQGIGGLVGTATSSTIKNSYAIGTISGGWNYRGGIVGNASSSTIENNYSKVKFGSGYGDVMCGGINYGNGTNSVKNNISFSTGLEKVITNDTSGSENNYYYYGKDSDENVADSGSIKVLSTDINEELFSKAHFDNKVWYLRNVTYDTLPTFVVENKTRLEGTVGYEADKEILYGNLTKLMPFYDKNKIVAIGSMVNDELLSKEEIAHIVPVDNNGNLVTYLTSSMPKRISKIKVVFKNNAKKEYNVIYDKTYDMVASYRIVELNIDYNYNHYVINDNSQVVNNLTNYLMGLDYTKNLDILTSKSDSRIYRDFYNEITKNELREFVLKVLSNSDYTNTSSDETINSYIERELKKDHRIEKLLYTYNYFRRFYDVDINGIKLYDFMMFNMQGFDSSLTPTMIADLYLKDSTGSSFNTNEINTKYAALLGGYTKLNSISKLLEYVVTSFSDYEMDDWVRSQFDGILVELPVRGHPEIKYTLWDHFSYEGSGYNVYNQVLPILTLPENAAYIISSPAQYIIGAQRTYMADPSNQEEVKAFKAKMETYTNRMQMYYETVYSILGDKDLFNNINLYQLDKRNTKTISGETVFNSPYTTTEPFHKNFNEVMGVWTAAAGNNAVAWGDRIEWMVAGVMDSTLKTDGTLDEGHVTFKTFTHESAHNLDGRLFLMGYGRRYDAGGEDYADSFLMQSFGINDIVMNFSINFNDDLKIGSNLKPERIDSPEEIHDFYDKAFQTIYIMDYLEARAFLQLSAQDQSEVAVQVSYPNEEKYKDDEKNKHLAYKTTKYEEISASAFEQMNLDSVDDLYNNKIMLYPGIYKNASRADNSYGGEGINIVHWYQPHNDFGRPDSYSLKWISYEMLGYAGYKDGFVEYASNVHSENGYKTDLMALKTISKNKYQSFDEYKIDRFKYVEEHLQYINQIIDVDAYVQKFYDALVEDGDNMKTQVENTIKNGTAAKTEQACINDYWCVRALATAKGLPKSTEVRQELYYALKTETKDFKESSIYFDTPQQTIGDLIVTKKQN